ncbi:MAG: glycosyltransferase family 4 protein [Candidatus Heimdallarchaeota archaeon]
MRIIYVCALPTSKKHKGGAGLVILQLGAYFSAKGHEVKVITRSKPSKSILQFARNKGIEILSPPSLPERILIAGEPLTGYKKLKKSISNSDIIQSVNGAYTFLASVLKTTQGASVISDIHEIFNPHLDPLVLLKLYHYRELLTLKIGSRLSNRILAHSESVRKEISQAWGLDSTVIPNGVDPDLFRPTKPKTPFAEKIAEMEGISLLFVGRLHYRKGILQLLAGLRLLRRQGREIHLFIVGDGELSKYANNLMKKLKIQDIVEFRGAVFQKELPEIYSAADWTIVPSISEAFGLVPLESLACGTPVIATKIGGLAETLHGSVAEFIDSCTFKAIANAILRATSWSLLPSSQNCREYVKTRYDWKRILPKYERFYQMAI